MQKDVLRWGDPMAHLVTKRLPTAAEEVAPSLVNEKNKKAMKKSGVCLSRSAVEGSCVCVCVLENKSRHHRLSHPFDRKDCC